MFRVKYILPDGKAEMKRYKSELSAKEAAEASITSGKARQAYVYVDSPEGLRLREICTDLKTEGEDNGRTSEND